MLYYIINSVLVLLHLNYYLYQVIVINIFSLLLGFIHKRVPT